jgi:hypothetical protein
MYSQNILHNIRIHIMVGSTWLLRRAGDGALSRAPGFRAGLSSPPLDLAVHLAEMQGCGPGTLTGFRGARGCWLSLLHDKIGVVVKEHSKRVVG